MHFSPIRTAVIAIVSILGLLFAIPSFLTPDQRAAWPSFLPHQTVVLGLDLQGGSHLLLQVNREGIIKERVGELRRDARTVLANDNGIGNLITLNSAGNGIEIELTDPAQHDAAVTALAGLQNTVSNSMFAVGGVNELAFGEAPDGKLRS
ncbi:MAG TPA: protein translocase subunit SecDF, partial [Devosia sp.]|nr:protein translocase subunit SecDF [Devosia sp.]